MNLDVACSHRRIRVSLSWPNTHEVNSGGRGKGGEYGEKGRMCVRTMLQNRDRTKFLAQPLSSTEVKGRVGLYLYSPSGPSWPVLGWTFLCLVQNFWLSNFQLSTDYFQLFGALTRYWWSFTHLSHMQLWCVRRSKDKFVFVYLNICTWIQMFIVNLVIQ